jgi:hypothetical protein
MGAIVHHRETSSWNAVPVVQELYTVDPLGLTAEPARRYLYSTNYQNGIAHLALLILYHLLSKYNMSVRIHRWINRRSHQVQALFLDKTKEKFF